MTSSFGVKHTRSRLYQPLFVFRNFLSRCHRLNKMILPAIAATALLGSLPNIVMVLTDDQDTLLGANATSYTELGSLVAQPNVRSLLMDNGVRMSNYFVNTPVCCPSRTEYFTGRYFHNVRGTDGVGCMHVNTTMVHLPDTGIFGLLTSAGYHTGVFGKSTNDQTSQLSQLVAHRTATYINSPSDVSAYMGLEWFRGFANGTKYTETINATNPVYGSPYQTSQISNRSVDWLKGINDDKPFFLYLGPHAPHVPAQPAPWYENAFEGIKAPKTVNYNISSPFKAKHVRQNPPINDVLGCWLDQHMRDRWASLLSVDDMLVAVHNTIRDMGRLDNTYFIYTSDHGYHLGQWSIPREKEHPYETDIRVPFLISGPGIPKGVELSDLAGAVDLLPTVLELAGLDIPAGVDGKSFAKRLTVWDGTTKPARDRLMVEYEAVGQQTNEFITTWTPNDFNCGGPNPKGPNCPLNATCVEGSGVHDGMCWYINSPLDGTYRALRIMNATHNTIYVEYDPTWSWNSTSINHFELYNITSDPYQMSNLYNGISEELKAQYHSEIVDFYRCEGALCP
eukprot:TRINITY_DN7880_c0_g1_i1.p1 TRINITY_DN7880_c0_g1~~TRINITY_DN7880_c0_g1_i1.p1  ORF type:complete len:565 (+),score=35.12 TRINITY_DN7880_c0_g1_i1:121-1815(+)